MKLHINDANILMDIVKLNLIVPFLALEFELLREQVDSFFLQLLLLAKTDQFGHQLAVDFAGLRVSDLRYLILIDSFLEDFYFELSLY